MMSDEWLYELTIITGDDGRQSFNVGISTGAGSHSFLKWRIRESEPKQLHRSCCNRAYNLVIVMTLTRSPGGLNAVSKTNARA